MSDLPTGWIEGTLGDVLTSVVGGGTPSRNVPAYFAGSIPWFTVKDMKSLKPMDAEEHISEAAIANSATTVLPANTLTVATRIALGRAMRPTVKFAINQDLKALFLGQGVEADFILYWVGAHARAIQDLGSGTTVSGIRLEALHGLPLLLPPAAEQTRIVAKLEELLSSLDAGVAQLKAAQQKLARYRQSLLKAAVTGELTTKWRAARALSTRAEAENGHQLLQRILAERRTRWEARQLAKFEQQGKTPPSGWQKKYPEPAAPDTSGLPELPQGWVWASVDQLSPDDLANGRSVPTAESGAKVLRLTAIKDGSVDLREHKQGAWSVEEAEPFAVSEGDLLIVRGNGSLTLVGRAGLVRSVKEQVAYPDTIIRLRVVESVVSPAWVGLVWDSHFVRSHLERRARTSAGIYKIAQSDIVTVVVPIPSLMEQEYIQQALAQQLEQVAAMQSAAETALKQSTAQRQNILRAAFAGQLVPQDPADEPASALLERIRAERAAQGPARKPRGRKKMGAA